MYLYRHSTAIQRNRYHFYYVLQSTVVVIHIYNITHHLVLLFPLPLPLPASIFFMIAAGTVSGMASVPMTISSPTSGVCTFEWDDGCGTGIGAGCVPGAVLPLILVLVFELVDHLGTSCSAPLDLRRSLCEIRRLP